MVFLASWLSSAHPLSDPALPRSEDLTLVYHSINFDWFIIILFLCQLASLQRYGLHRMVGQYPVRMFQHCHATLM